MELTKENSNKSQNIIKAFFKKDSLNIEHPMKYCTRTILMDSNLFCGIEQQTLEYIVGVNFEYRAYDLRSYEYVTSLLGRISNVKDSLFPANFVFDKYIKNDSFERLYLIVDKDIIHDPEIFEELFFYNPDFRGVEMILHLGSSTEEDTRVLNNLGITYTQIAQDEFGEWLVNDLY